MWGRKKRFYRIVALFLIVAFQNYQIPAVIFLNQNSADHNTSKPEGELNGSGWDLHGFFNAFTGIHIHRNCFITAKHIGGHIGNTFRYQNVDYQTIAYYPDPKTDLIIWQVDAPLSMFAKVADSLPGVGSEVVVFGRGTQKGDPIFASDTDAESIGWSWGKADRVMRWGTNRISAIINASNHPVKHDSIEAFNFACRFNNFLNPNECTLSSGDSGGGIFSKFGNAWNLIGINYAVTGPYRSDPNSLSFNASVYNGSSLYIFRNNKWVLNNANFGFNESQFFATAIPARMEWIEYVVGIIDENIHPIEILISDTVDGHFTQSHRIELDWKKRKIEIPVSGETKFFKIKNELGYQIDEPKLIKSYFSISFR